MSNATAEKLTNGDINTTHKIILRSLTEMQVKGDQKVFIVPLRDRIKNIKLKKKYKNSNWKKKVKRL